MRNLEPIHHRRLRFKRCKKTLLVYTIGLWLKISSKPEDHVSDRIKGKNFPSILNAWRGHHFSKRDMTVLTAELFSKSAKELFFIPYIG